MQLYIDTANLQEIQEASRWGVISGVTTNPSLLAAEGMSMSDAVDEISRLVPGPMSVEVVSTDAGEMVQEAHELAQLADNVVVKVPVTADGLQAVSRLSADGVDCNVTLVFSVAQSLLAARAGAAYVSPFVGRLDDIGSDGIEVVRKSAEVFAYYDLQTEIIAASIRHPQHVLQAASAGADIATVPYAVLKKMLHHPLTDTGLQRFLDDWQQMQDESS